MSMLNEEEYAETYNLYGEAMRATKASREENQIPLINASR
jgi:hypothetical protein